MANSPESLTVCKGGILPLSLYSDFKFDTKICPEKLWITVDTGISVYFIQTSIVSPRHRRAPVPPHRSVLSRLA